MKQNIKPKKSNTTENQTNPLYTILRAVGLLGLLLTFFLGYMHQSGDIITASIFSIILFGIMVGLPIYLKNHKEEEKLHKKSTTEIGLVIGYTVAVFISFIYTFHFIDVEFNRKTEIQTEAKGKITSIEKLVEEYTTIKNRVIESKLNERSKIYNICLANPYSASAKSKFLDVTGMEFDVIKDEGNQFFIDEQQKHKADLGKQYSEKTALNSIKYFETIQIAKNIFGTTSLIKVGFNKTFYSLDDYFYTVQDALNKKIALYSTDDKLEFHPEKSAVNFDNPITSLKNSSITTLIIVFVIAVLFHCMVLAEYFFGKRYDTGTTSTTEGNGNDMFSM